MLRKQIERCTSYELTEIESGSYSNQAYFGSLSFARNYRLRFNGLTPDTPGQIKLPPHFRAVKKQASPKQPGWLGGLAPPSGRSQDLGAGEPAAVRPSLPLAALGAIRSHHLLWVAAGVLPAILCEKGERGQTVVFRATSRVVSVGDGRA